MTDKPATRLRDARIKRGYDTAHDAARAFGWPMPTYASHENGTRGLRRDVALKYAKAFGVEPGWLLGFAEEQNVNGTATEPSPAEVEARNPENDAMLRVYNILCSFDRAARIRMLDYVTARLDAEHQ